ncbi:Rdx family protein [Demequina sp. B12]|uniref:Rdx family protein n=1 Tax=Demequina sp. B12 TaxID=2992757 RepID=UPI00237B8493|nr:Rdx family protein [Demequina sp. B12]MDE0573154.1 Rdx family protein [Demequina sp. B12]
MKIDITYCVPCGYLERAIDAQRTLLSTFGGALESVALVTGDKGVFTIAADGVEIYSKPADFDITQVVEAVKAKLQ